MADGEEYINIGSTESMDKKLIKKMLKKAPYPEGMMACVVNGELWMVLLKNGKILIEWLKLIRLLRITGGDGKHQG